MKRILATVAGLAAFALGASACSAVDTEATSTTPIAVASPERLRDEVRDFKTSRSAARPVITTPVTKPVVKPKVTKPAVKKPVVKAKKVKPKKVHKTKVVKTYKAKKPVKKVYKETKGKKVSISGIAFCIGKYESGNNPKAQNKTTSASGYYQFVDGTWNGYGGYRRAKDAPLSVQTAKFYQVWNGGKGAHHWVVAHKCGY